MQKKAIYFVIVCGVLLFVFGMLYGLLMFLLRPFNAVQKPVADYGEFPFKLVYEQNGELVTIEDTLVIEYEGVVFGEEINNKWNAYRLSGEQDAFEGIPMATVITLYQAVDEFGYPTTIHFILGSCEYYMGLEERATSIDIHAGDIVVKSHGQYCVITETELYDRYGIKVIEKTISAPLSLERKTGGQ